MSIGTLFSFCAGILIGLKWYYKHHQKKENRDILKEERAKYEFLTNIWYGSWWKNGQDG